MYYPYKNGFSKTIGYDGLAYSIHFPKVGYVYNYFTGEIEKTQIINEGLPKKDQKWVKTELPLNYNNLRREEKKRQKTNPNYVDYDLEKFRQREWYRRKNGVWVMINGQPIYFTGFYYFFLCYLQFDFGIPEFMYTQCEMFWFIQWCIENPNSYGVNFYGSRRMGKSTIGGAFLLDYTIQTKYAYSGFQSKEEKDARANFHKYVRDPFLRIPDFFRPNFNTSGQMVKEIDLRIPFDEKKFDETGVYDEGLNSKLNYAAGEENSYDAFKLHRYWRDEGGKLENTDVYVGWKRTQPALFDPFKNRIIGKAYFCTTIEDLGANANPFMEFLAHSSPTHTKNGKTTSGLMEYFVPAQYIGEIDEYGFPLVEENLKTINKRRSNINDIVLLYEEIRKFPTSREEAKLVSRIASPYNQKILNDAYNTILNMVTPPYVKGDYIWVEKDKKARFEPNPVNGKWDVCHILPNELANRVKENITSESERKYSPLNTHNICIGTDPTKQGGTATSRFKSSVGVTILMKDENGDKMFIADYLHRPDDPEHSFEDILIACFFHGASTLVEKQDMSAMYSYFKKRGYINFIDDKPKILLSEKNSFREEKGIASSTGSINYYTSLFKTFISNYGSSIKLPRLLSHLIHVTPQTRTQFDLHSAGGMTLLQAESERQEEKELNGEVYYELFGSAFGFNTDNHI